MQLIHVYRIHEPAYVLLRVRIHGGSACACARVQAHVREPLVPVVVRWIVASDPLLQEQQNQ